MNLFRIIEDSSNNAIRSQRSNGSMPPGHNGPYNDPETSVRNTAHWCISFLKAYQISDNQQFLDAAVKCGEYLLSDEARPMDSVFFCRKNPEKDFANGLVGQAWAIEALVELFKATSEKKYIELAVEVFLEHPYDDYYHGWIRRNVDGSFNGFDKTFNHELWFAAAGSMLIEFNEDIEYQVKDFMQSVNDHLEIYKDGCIRHKGMFLKLSPREVIKGTLRKYLEKPKVRKYMRMKSEGYHGFNLYAFALLKRELPAHSFWESKKFRKTLKFANSDRFRSELPESKYGFPYNPPGFEMAFAFQEFGYVSEEEISKWISWQIKTCYDFETKLMVKGDTPDKNTSAARIYEATRLKNYSLHITDAST